METKETMSGRFAALVKYLLRQTRLYWDIPVTVLLALCVLAGFVWYGIRWTDPEEAGIRQSVVQTARQYLGCNESDGSHQKIVDRYNSYTPSPRGYTLTYEDNWCAAFGSATALEAGLADWIPMECSCEQQILLFSKSGDWQENECYLPRPGDYIYYVWDEWRDGDCTAWANHVGIVAETFGPVIKVIEGNKDDAVGYRYIFLNDITIRGFGLPDYRKIAASS
ncbi:MAG: hypothetical protein IKU68_07420 [Oscillospiraceae bacterium]|nr:hypothetical protein [Oscillospiraceae bacterium]